MTREERVDAGSERVIAEYIEKETLDSELYNRFHDEDEPSNITDVRLGSVRNFVRDFPTADVIPIPEGATNGDMIKAMFPNAEYRKDRLENVFIISDAQLGYIVLRECWWNAPYKGECNLSEKLTGSESEDGE